MADRKFLEEASQKLADKGLLIEAGWLAFRIMFLQSAPPVALRLARLAYMSGAQHLFASILAMLESGDEETPADLRRMELIQHELDAFTKELDLLAAKSEGHG